MDLVESREGCGSIGLRHLVVGEAGLAIPVGEDGHGSVLGLDQVEDRTWCTRRGSARACAPAPRERRTPRTRASTARCRCAATPPRAGRADALRQNELLGQSSRVVQRGRAPRPEQSGRPGRRRSPPAVVGRVGAATTRTGSPPTCRPGRARRSPSPGAPVRRWWPRWCATNPSPGASPTEVARRRRSHSRSGHWSAAPWCPFRLRGLRPGTARRGRCWRPRNPARPAGARRERRPPRSPRHAPGFAAWGAGYSPNRQG